jgi:hypothetical protein
LIKKRIEDFLYTFFYMQGDIFNRL